MTERFYIERTLIADKGRPGERVMGEGDLASLTGPLIILGDPGLGKTRLTEALEKTLGGVRITGGTFYRTEDFSRFAAIRNNILIIDGLDEISAASGQSAVDEVLKRLSKIGAPRFILSCRAADWQGSADRHKITADYGVEPVTLLLQPFSSSDAIQFLKSFDATLDAESIVSTLDERDLGELCENPLTLTLVAELAKSGEGLPQTRSDLFVRACDLLVKEMNPAHSGSRVARASLADLLDSAGALFAHLLLSGALGVADRARHEVPMGYVGKAEFVGISQAPEITGALETRLFQSVGEGLSAPFHRMIAEFLGARWLSKRISDALSERRVLQAFGGSVSGIPSALRGLHAWLAFFNSSLTLRCIKTDPYGVLRYGELGRLSVEQARALLSALSSLANEDPYFRSEDWGRRAVAGLAREELKDELVGVIKNPDRHIHLSTLLLESLAGSELTQQIIPELVALVCDSSAVYAERINAAEALLKSNSPVDWLSVYESLRSDGSHQSKRLVLDIISHDSGEHFTDVQISDSIFDYQNPAAGEDQEAHVSGMDYLLVNNLPPALCSAVLDGLARRMATAGRTSRFDPVKNELATTVHRLITKVLNSGLCPPSGQLWLWLRSLRGARGYSSHDCDQIAAYIKNHSTIRREIQSAALAAEAAVGDPWTVIVHDLPSASSALAITLDDSEKFLREIGSKTELSSFDVELWTALVQCQRRTTGIADQLDQSILYGVQKHETLGERWRQLNAPPERDWQKESQEREERFRVEQARKFERHRSSFMPHLEEIRGGVHIGCLHDIAKAYLNLYADLDHDASPDDRIRQWLGDEIADAALQGFVNALSRNDLPLAKDVAKTHAEGKVWHCENVIICGILETLKEQRSINEISIGVLELALAAWWEHPDFNSNRYGKTAQLELERAVLHSAVATERFLEEVVTPRVQANSEYISVLYRMPREDHFRSCAGKLGIKWLKENPGAPAKIQWQLLEIALALGHEAELQALLRDRLSNVEQMEPELRRMWMASAFMLLFDAARSELETFCAENRDHLWTLRQVMTPERSMPRRTVSPEQYGFIVELFAPMWPPEAMPRSGWGDTNDWNATEFIRSCINAIGADLSDLSSAILDRLVANDQVAAYRDQLKHVRAQQRRSRRDKEFLVPSFAEVKKMLAGGLPSNADDIKALLMDVYDIVQDYLRNSDTDSWEAFWVGDKPKDENTCRHRLVDQMRPRIFKEIALLPETLMPEENRADIVAIYSGFGLPTEIKGQWHPDLWDAAKVQLIEKYARDWRADGCGIYLVLWFGSVRGKALPRHPDGQAAPNSPGQLRQMLLDRLSDSERAKIDVVVLDVSKGKKPQFHT